jgi:iron complex outermembrane receptor protein
MSIMLALSAMVGLSANVWAQDSESDELALEEVIVTATRVETNLMKTPIAVSAFTQDQMERAGVNNVSDLANLVPNMDISTINGQSTPIVSMRGVRSTNETELGDPAVGIHLDGVYSPRMQGILALMFDNERVEVLRGPQGTLFGRNSTVGTVNIITAKPDAEAFYASANVAVGNYNARELTGVLNFPITDNFAIRFSGRWNERESYLDGYYDPNQYDQRYVKDLVADAPVIATNVYPNGDDPGCVDERCVARTQWNNWWLDWVGADNGWSGYDVRDLVKADPDNFYNNIDEWAYRISAQWDPTDDLSVFLSYQQYRNDSAGGIDLVNCEKLRGRPTYDADGNVNGVDDCGNGLFPKDDTYQAVVNVPGLLYLDIQYLRGVVDWNINDSLVLKYLVGYEDQDRESAQDMEQSLNAWDGSMFFLPGTGSESYSHEIQLQSYGNDRLNWILGGNFFHEKTTTLGYYDNSINDKSFWDQPDRSTDAWSVFGQATWSFTESWHLTLGWRHSDETKEDVGGRSYACTNDNGCAPGWYFRETLNALPTDAWHDPSIYPTYSENDNKGSWDHDDFRIGLDWDLSADTLIYTYLASGFKSGGIGDVFSETNPRTGEEINVRTSFGPEEVLTWELGAKTMMLDGRLKLQATYFYSDYDDMQYASVGTIAVTDRWVSLRDEDGQPILDENGQPVFGWESAPIVAYYTQNVPGAEIQGIEVEFDWLPYENGHIWGYFSWLDTEITKDWVTKWNYDAVSYFGITYEESIDPENEMLIVNLKGNELAVSPTYKFNLNYTHDFNFDAGTLVPWVNIHWEDDSYLTLWNVDRHTDDLDFVIRDEDIKYTDDKRDSFWTMNATLRFYRNDWWVELYGYNLTDEVVQYWGGAAEGVAKGSFSTPRTYGLRFNYEFY